MNNLKWSTQELLCIKRFIKGIKLREISQYKAIKELKNYLPNRTEEGIRSKIKSILKGYYPI